MGCIHGAAKSLTQWNTHTYLHGSSHHCARPRFLLQNRVTHAPNRWECWWPTAFSWVPFPHFHSHRKSHLTQNHTSSLGAQSFSYHVLIRANSQVPPLLQNSLWDQWRPLLELVLVNVLQRNKPNRRYIYIYTHIHVYIYIYTHTYIHMYKHTHTHTHMKIYHNELPHKIMEAKKSLNLPFSRWKPR